MLPIASGSSLSPWLRPARQRSEPHHRRGACAAVRPGCRCGHGAGVGSPGCPSPGLEDRAREALALEQSNLVVTRFLLASALETTGRRACFPHPPAVPAGRPIRGAGRLRSDRDHARRPGTSGRRRKGRRCPGLVHPCADRGLARDRQSGKCPRACPARGSRAKKPWRAGSPPGPRRGESRRHPLSARRGVGSPDSVRDVPGLFLVPARPAAERYGGFKVTDVTHPAQPAVFAIVGGIRGYSSSNEPEDRS